jgi:hypothetical protein
VVASPESTTAIVPPWVGLCARAALSSAASRSAPSRSARASVALIRNSSEWRVERFPPGEVATTLGSPSTAITLAGAPLDSAFSVISLIAPLDTGLGLFMRFAHTRLSGPGWIGQAPTRSGPSPFEESIGATIVSAATQTITRAMVIRWRRGTTDLVGFESLGFRSCREDDCSRSRCARTCAFGVSLCFSVATCRRSASNSSRRSGAQRSTIRSTRRGEGP